MKIATQHFKQTAWCGHPKSRLARFRCSKSLVLFQGKKLAIAITGVESLRPYRHVYRPSKEWGHFRFALLGLCLRICWGHGCSYTNNTVHNITHLHNIKCSFQSCANKD